MLIPVLFLLASAHAELPTGGALTREYFLNPHAAAYDLNEFKKLRQKFKRDIRIHELTTSDILGSRITCYSGDEVGGYEYLDQAQKRLEKKDFKEALNSIKETAGFKSATEIEIDEEYLNKPKYIDHDLKEFAKGISKRLGREINVKDINTFYIWDTKIICANGQEITGGEFITLASKILNIRNDNALEILKESSQIKMDDLYFNNAEYLAYDLDGFAKELSKKLKGKVKISDLNVENLQGIETTCYNGEKLSGAKYLSIAEHKVGERTLRNTLISLKERSGFNSKNDDVKITRLDEDYFNNEKYVTYDLKRFAQAFSIKSNAELNIENLSTSDFMLKFSDVKITCYNGEEISPKVYLRRAKEKIGPSQKITTIKGALTFLKGKAGVVTEVEEVADEVIEQSTDEVTDKTSEQNTDEITDGSNDQVVEKPKVDEVEDKDQVEPVADKVIGYDTEVFYQMIENGTFSTADNVMTAVNYINEMLDKGSPNLKKCSVIMASVKSFAKTNNLLFSDLQKISAVNKKLAKVAGTTTVYNKVDVPKADHDALIMNLKNYLGITDDKYSDMLEALALSVFVKAVNNGTAGNKEAEMLAGKNGYLYSLVDNMYTTDKVAAFYLMSEFVKSQTPELVTNNIAWEDCMEKYNTRIEELRLKDKDFDLKIELYTKDPDAMKDAF